MTQSSTLKLVLVDDHTLFRKGMISLLEMVNPNIQVLFEADNGLDLQVKINQDLQPDIILMDISMPGMDGFECVEWLSKHYPLVKILVVSMVEKEETVVRMLQLGVKGYICKDVEPQQLSEALNAIMSKGYYYTDYVTGRLIHSLKGQNGSDNHNKRPASLTDRELQFLILACSELTYSEIAAKMFLSPKTIDGYRIALFEKFGVRTRVGLVMYAIKNGLVEV